MENLSATTRKYFGLAIGASIVGAASIGIGLEGAQLSDSANAKLNAGCGNPLQTYKECVSEIAGESVNGSYMFTAGLVGGATSLLVVALSSKRMLFPRKEY